MVSILSYSGSIARIRAFYGRGNGPIVLDNLFCNGREASLFHCPFVTTQDSNPTLRMLEYDASVKVSLNMYMYLYFKEKRQKLIVVGIRNIVFQSTVSENKTKRNILKIFPFAVLFHVLLCLQFLLVMYAQFIFIFVLVSCDEGSIRLVGGASDLEGRLEVCLDQAWGTVTDFFFNLPDARVACRQLGYNDTSECCTNLT